VFRFALLDFFVQLFYSYFVFLFLCLFFLSPLPPFYYHRSYIKSQETYRHIAYIYHVNMKKSPDTYRVRAYFKGFISFLLCSVLLNPINYFCDKQQKHKCCYIWCSCCCSETDIQSTESKGAFCSNAAPCFFI